MSNFEDVLKRALNEIHKNNKLKELTSLPVYFVINYGSINWSENKNNLIDLIKKDKITIFEKGKYSSFSSKQKEYLDGILEKDDFLLGLNIGLP